MTLGPATGRRKRVTALRALLPCLALMLLDDGLVHAQTVTPDLFSPGRDAFAPPLDSPLRRTGDNSDPVKRPGVRRQTGSLGNSRIGQIRCCRCQRRFGLRLRFAQSRTQKAKAVSGPSQAETFGRSRQRPARRLPAGRLSIPPSEAANKTPIAAGDGGHGDRPAAAQAAEDRRRSVRRRRRLRRQLPDQVGGRTGRRLRHQSRLAPP